MLRHWFQRSRFWLISLPILVLVTIAIAQNAPQAALPDLAATTSIAEPSGQKTAVLAGGCFWGMEAVFERVKGVSDVVSGFSGGSADTATYDQVSRGQTAHAEAVKITYDPTQVSYAQLLKIYFSVVHDPTQVNRQGPDSGTQYRSAIFFASPEQQKIAQAYINQLNQSKVFDRAIATQLAPLTEFYAAEDYHQNFIVHNPANPYVVVHDLPKLAQLQKQFPDIYKP